MDETQRLIMEVVNAQKIKELTGFIEEEKESIRKLNEQLAAGKISQDEFNKQAGSSAALALTFSKEVDSLKKSTRDLGQATLYTSYALQDLAQGGLGGILNNIPQLVTALGGGAGLAGLLAGVGVAAYVATPYVKSLWKAFTDGPNSIPATVDALDRTKERLGEVQDALKKLKEGWDGTNTSLAKHNELQAEAVRLEQEAAKAQEREAARKRAKQEEDQAGNSPEVAAAAKGAVNALGGFDDAVNAVRNALTAESRQLAAAKANVDAVEKANQQALQNPNILNPFAQVRAGAAIAAARRQRDEVSRGIEGDAADLVERARQGNPDAVRELARLVPGGGFNNATPEFLAGQKEAAENAKEEQERLKQEAKDKEQEAKDKVREKQVADKEKERQDKEKQAEKDRAAKQEQSAQDEIRDAIAKTTERMDRDLERGDQDLASERGEDFVRDVEADEFGGLGLSRKQVQAIAAQVQRGVDVGGDPLAEAIAAIQKVVQNQQGLANEAQQRRAQLQQIMQQAQTVPDLLQWGNGW